MINREQQFNNDRFFEIQNLNSLSNHVPLIFPFVQASEEERSNFPLFELLEILW